MARRVKSLKHGDAKEKNIPWHREHRSKKGRLKYRSNWGNALLFKKKKQELLENELLKENGII